MGAAALPPPGGGGPPGGPPQGGTPFPSPAAAQPGGNMALMEKIRAIVSIARQIAQDVPGAFDEVRQINDAVGRLQQKVIQQQGPAEPAAPPV